MEAGDHVSQLLGTLDEQDFQSEAEGLTAITQATAAINAELAQLAPGEARTFAVDARLHGDWSERLEEWIGRLRDIVVKVVQRFGAESYTLTVGATWPPGVSVSITWPAPAAKDWT